MTICIRGFSSLHQISLRCDLKTHSLVCLWRVSATRTWDLYFNPETWSTQAQAFTGLEHIAICLGTETFVRKFTCKVKWLATRLGKDVTLGQCCLESNSSDVPVDQQCFEWIALRDHLNSGELCYYSEHTIAWDWCRFHVVIL